MTQLFVDCVRFVIRPLDADQQIEIDYSKMRHSRTRSEPHQ